MDSLPSETAAPLAGDDAMRFADAVNHRARGLDALRAGSYADALALFVQAERLFHQAKAPVQVAWTMQNSAQAQEFLGHQPQAVALFTGAEAIFRYHGEKQGFPLMFRRRGDTMRRQGRQDAALAMYCEGEALYRTFHEPAGIIAILSSKAATYLVQGRDAEANAALSEAELRQRDFPRRHGEVDFLLHVRLARVLGRSGKEHEAKDHLRQASEIADLARLHDDRSNPDVIAELPRLGEVEELVKG